jgi:tripartite ATP-independent transporter DctM subunit
MHVGFITIAVFIGLLILLGTGLPVAFSLMGISVLFMLFFFGPEPLYLIATSAFSQMRMEIIIAIPLFVFMSTVLQVSGIGEGLYDAMYKWMGRVRGGLAIGTIIACTLIAAMTGLGGTGVIIMGLLALPEMLKRNYNKQLSLGTIVAGGALGPLIPPSAILVLLGAYSNLSIGKLFIGGIVPGVIMSVIFIIYVAVKAYLNPQIAPALGVELRITWKEKFLCLRHLILPIILIIVVLGSLYSGMCTPTEAAGFGAFGALVCTAIHRRLNWDTLKQALFSSLNITVMVIWLLIGGSCYATFLGYAGVRDFIASALVALPIGNMGIVVLMMVIALVLGMFIDSGAIVVICIPIFMPAIKMMGIDPLWFGINFIIALIVGFISPPFGMNLFYMKGIAPEGITMMDIYRGSVPFCVMMVIALVICMIFPSITMWLPNRM